MRPRLPPPDLHKLLENLDSAKDELMKILDRDLIPADDDRATPVVASSKNIDQNPKNILVGFTDDILQLKGRVLGESSELEIIPIVGMGGIGKTTLARKIHGDASIVSHFDVRAWTTVSEDYSLYNILLDLVSSMPGERHDRDEMIEEEDHKLGDTLYKSLIGRRYIIVLDDIWRSTVWDDVKKFFPNNNNGSRIILTTRESNVATYVDSKSQHHHVRPLGEVDSWKLLRKKVFGEETCQYEMEKLGMQIAISCGGLPLAIHVIGGLLSHIEKTKATWEQVAGDIISAIVNRDEQFSGIFSLSYDHLPYYLKPCFLYMSAFPEDYEIKASRLIRFWVAEGFPISIEDKSPEEVAEEHLDALIDRNLIFVSRRTTTGKVKTCFMHDLLRDLCVLKAHEKKFFHVINGRTRNVQEDMLCLRRVSVFAPRFFHDSYSSKRLKSLTRSLVFVGQNGSKIQPRVFSTFWLLRVLDLLEIKFSHFPQALLQLLNLRYLGLSCRGKLNPCVIKFRDLQTLIYATNVRRTNVPHEIFEMPHLREIVFIDTSLRCDLKQLKNDVVQGNLQSLSTLEISANFDVVLAKLPNLKKLAIYYSHESDSTFSNLACLRKLETLEFTSRSTPEATNFLSNVTFPFSLKKLTLRWCEVCQAFMKAIGMMPNLEVLKLYNVSFGSSENWSPSEGEFCRLRYLRLEWVDLVDWIANETHFPRLQHLKIRNCYLLNEIPSDIGEIPTLETIKVHTSSHSVMASARKIQQEQVELGNELLQVYVNSSF